MKNQTISLILAILLSVPVGICAYNSQKREVTVHEVNMDKYIGNKPEDIKVKVLGEEPNTDFEPAFYPEEKNNPYPDAIEKHIEATAYCYGTTTCTGKKVREGYAAMSKRYLGMTAVVYEADDNGEPLDYIGTYEIEDTGGDERIKNGNCIDIYMESYSDAITFGRKQVVVYLIEAKG